MVPVSRNSRIKENLHLRIVPSFLSPLPSSYNYTSDIIWLKIRWCDSKRHCFCACITNKRAVFYAINDQRRAITSMQYCDSIFYSLNESFPKRKGIINTPHDLEKPVQRIPVAKAILSLTAASFGRTPAEDESLRNGLFSPSNLL